MSEQPRTRQQLYERIRKTSREEFILEEMIRLGFWPKKGTIPADPADEIRRRGELERELQRLRAESLRFSNEKALLREYRKKRLRESRKKQYETRELREFERQERAEAWERKKQLEIVYLGENVSGGLNYVECNLERLASHGLPALSKADEIAEAMGVSVSHLRFLAFSRTTSEVNHYVRFKLPKKTGGERAISAPMPKLKRAQEWILHNILEKVAVDAAAHGFRKAHSIVTNARPHVGSDAIVNIDLKDFFPTINYRRVKGLFRGLGYSEQAATIFALICTEPDVEEVVLDQKTYYVALSERHLPQGAPTSPAITNILCRRLDRRLRRLAESKGFVYTRYADDLTFSASGDNLKALRSLILNVTSIVEHEGFAVNESKTRVLRKSQQQEVTGVVVNSKPAVSRKELKKFRALLFQIEKDGLTGKRWGNSPDLLAAISGYASFVCMVDPVKGAAFKTRIAAIASRYGAKPAKPSQPTSVEENTKSEQPSTKQWWKLF